MVIFITVLSQHCDRRMYHINRKDTCKIQVEAIFLVSSLVFAYQWLYSIHIHSVSWTEILQKYYLNQIYLPVYDIANVKTTNKSLQLTFCSLSEHIYTINKIAHHCSIRKIWVVKLTMITAWLRWSQVFHYDKTCVITSKEWRRFLVNEYNSASWLKIVR